MSQKLSILLVTCCLEESRAAIARQVINNIVDVCPPSWRDEAIVFDNCSTHLAPQELRRAFRNVVVSSRNVGYWSAIDWWLNSLVGDPPEYTYIIESDMVHTAAAWQMHACVEFLDAHRDLGAMRMHDYQVAERHLYDKDNPRPDSRRNLWQSHTNRVTGRPVQHQHVSGPFWRTNFLTQLPALNRYPAMLRCFDELRSRVSFTEPDFQALYHEQYPEIAILDGGMFNCDLNPYGTDVVTGSWTSPEALKRLGYHGTRTGSIARPGEYTTSWVP